MIPIGKIGMKRVRHSGPFYQLYIQVPPVLGPKPLCTLLQEGVTKHFTVDQIVI